ncbi:MAG: UvrD-helicase domain-containing protein [Desulfobacteraceae bacterium]|nr:UvrD-helicase domain-containing protein [Desulfobacteraceae bacterium]
MAILADAAKRARALDPAASFHLEAPAGSGKTFLLTARFLRLLQLAGHPEQILALTFTNKAAAEMRERVRTYLNRAKKGAEAGSEADAELLFLAAGALGAHRKFEELLLAGEILRIQTFHSFCYSVAAQAPLEAGITPGSTLMDEREQEVFLLETVEAVLAEIAARKEGDAVRRALMNRLLYLNNNWLLLSEEIADLVRRRESLPDLVRVMNRDRAEGYIAEQVRALAEKELLSLRADFSTSSIGNGWEGFVGELEARGASAADELPREVPGADWESLEGWICVARVLLTQSGTVRKQPGPKAGFFSGFGKTRWGEALQNLPEETAERLHRVRALPTPDAPVRDPETLWDLILLLHAVLEAYDARSRAGRALDFSALETAALRLFNSATPSDLQLVMDQQIRHILVDEFQDTNREQWELLRKLCEGWSEGDGRTLLLVGDPKQSIYGFRKAEVGLFMDAREGLPLPGGGRVALEPLVLDTNFRSQPHLIEWCNGLFGATVMASHAPEYDEVPFSPAVPSPTTEVLPGSDAPELALFLEWPDRESARRREAAWLAERVARWADGAEKGSSAAILLFSRTHLSLYLEALQERNTPVQVKEGLKLSERPEVRYLHQLCRGIVLPHDDLAWAAQLRSPWLMLDFDRIHRISRESPELWVEKIRAFAEHDEQTARFRDRLAAAWQRIGHEPLADVVEAAWLDLGGAEIIAARAGGRGINCCRRFLSMLREAEEGEPASTLMRFEHLLENAYEPVDPDSATSSVTLSTVHGAKGLEFDTVFLPFLDWNPAGGKKGQLPPYMLERPPGSAEPLLAPRPDRLMGAEDPLYNWLRKLRSRRQLGEAKRLFYVALTRARRAVVMSAVLRGRGGGFSTAAADGPLGWLSGHYGLDGMVRIDDIACPDRAGDGAGFLSSCGRTVSSAEGDFCVRVEPEVASAAVAVIQPAAMEIEPARFEREKPAFKVVSPSSLTEFEANDSLGQIACQSHSLCPPNVWGTLIHRMFAEWGRSGGLPSPAEAGAFLRQENVDAGYATELAQAALEEVRLCLDDPWLKAFYDLPSGCRKVEWPVESIRDSGVLFSGIVDLAAQFDGKWKIVDFKTSRLAEGESVEEFRSREMDLYRPQLAAYREMWAGLTGADEAEIEVFLYWTALREPGRFRER